MAKSVHIKTPHQHELLRVSICQTKLSGAMGLSGHTPLIDVSEVGGTYVEHWICV